MKEYRILSKLGQEGYSKNTFKAERVGSGQLCIIKKTAACSTFHLKQSQSLLHKLSCIKYTK